MTMYNYYVKKDNKVTSYVKEEEREIKTFVPSQHDVLSFIDTENDKKVKKPGFAGKIEEDFEYLKKKDEELFEEIITVLTLDIMAIKNEADILDTTDQKMYEDPTETINELDENLKVSLEYSLSNFNKVIKYILVKYIRLYVSYIDEKTANSYLDDINMGKNALLYIPIRSFDMDCIHDEKMRSYVSTVFKYTLNKKIKECKRHLCFDCPVPLTQCPKIMAETNLTLDDSVLDFIEEGEQKTHYKKVLVGRTQDGYGVEIKADEADNYITTSERDEEVTDYFLVTKCKKYSAEIKRRVRKANNVK